MIMTTNNRDIIVNLRNVGIANLKLQVRSEENPLRREMDRRYVKIDDERGAWRVSDVDHAFLLEESRLRETNNVYDEKLASKVKEEEKKKIDSNLWMKAEKK